MKDNCTFCMEPVVAPSSVILSVFLIILCVSPPSGIDVIYPRWYWIGWYTALYCCYALYIWRNTILHISFVKHRIPNFFFSSFKAKIKNHHRHCREHQCQPLNLLSSPQRLFHLKRIGWDQEPSHIKPVNRNIRNSMAPGDPYLATIQIAYHLVISRHAALTLSCDIQQSCEVWIHTCDNQLYGLCEHIKRHIL